MRRIHMPLATGYARLIRRITALLALLLGMAGLIPIAPWVKTAHADSALFSFPTYIGGGGITVAMGDFNEDGILDFILGRAYDANQIYLGTGDGAFSAPVDLPSTGIGLHLTTSVAVGDLNGDGILDVVIANATDGSGDPFQPSQVLLGSGDGTFREPIALPIEVGFMQVAAALGDLNGDGKLDLVFSTTQVLLGNGDGTFTQMPNLPAINPPSAGTDYAIITSVAVADFNGDGRLDIGVGTSTYASNAGPPSQVYVGHGDGTFAAPSSLAGSGHATSSIAVGDLNGDGKFDLVLGNSAMPSQVYLARGDGSFSGPTSLLGSGHSTTSVAVGDLDGDARLDLILVNADAAPQVYLGKGDGAFAQPIDLSGGSASLASASLAIGDVTGDGRLDLIVANRDGPGQIYRGNLLASFGAPNDLLGSGNLHTYAVVVGDFNGDGKLDLVLGNAYGHTKVYLGKGDGGFSGPTSLPGNIQSTAGVAVADFNGDGKLDLILGNYYGAASQVYLGNGDGTFAAPTDLPSSDPFDITSVAVGDLNGDGKLDIVLGTAHAIGATGSPGQVYLGLGNGGFTGPTYLAGDNYTSSVAVGDLNGDGVLDLVLGNTYGPNQIYLGNGDGSFTQPTDLLGSVGSYASVALGDLNGDGKLDLVSGNYYGTPSRVYLGNGDGSFTQPTDLLGSVGSQSVALGDLNGDGRLDIVLANRGIPSQVFLGHGDGSFSLPNDLLGSAKRTTTSVAVGDLNSDGVLDIILGNDFNVYGDNAPSSSQFFLSTRAHAPRLQNNPPMIAITRPGATGNANFYSTPTILDDRIIPIKYTLMDREGDPVGAVQAFYSLDGGGDWRPAIAASDTITTNLAASPAGTTHIYNWDIFANGVFGRFDNVVFRILALPVGRRIASAPVIIAGDKRTFIPLISRTKSTVGLVPGSYQWPYAAATTFPFRVRGTQVRVVSAAQPSGAAGALVYRRHAGQTGAPLPTADRPLRTDPQGYLQGHGEIDVGDQLVALQPITSTNTYTIYLSSATPITTGLDTYTVQAPGVQTLTVSPEHALALFDLTISLEWDARADPQFIAQLAADLKRTSELLFNWTKGQAALRKITIYHDKLHWQDAQIRVYASNRIRPNANKGGIATRGDHVRIGAVWNRYGDVSGTVGEDWPRALAHELGHYAFGLDDNYLGLDAQGRLIPVASCPGVMSNPYRTDQSDFRPVADWLPDCEVTLSNRENDQADWATIVANYPQLHAPVDRFTHMSPGPSILPLAVTQVSFVDPLTPTATLAAPIFYLTRAEDHNRYLPAAGARVFLFTCADGQAAGGACQSTDAQDLIDLGQPAQDQVLARGARPGDRLCVYDLGALGATGQSAPRLGCLIISQGSTPLEMSVTSGWQPEVSITPDSTTTVRATVGNLPPGLVLRARFYPANGLAPDPLALAYDALNNTYSAIFTLSAPSTSGYLHIWVDEPNPRREVVADYGLGGNPVHREGGGGFAPVLSPDGQVLLYGKDLNFVAGQFYTLQAATHIPTPPPWETVVGPAYRLSAPSGVDVSGASIAFNYLGRDIPPGEERWVTVYYLPEHSSTWQPLQTTRAITTNSAMATIPITSPRGLGLYALMSSIEIPLFTGVNYFAYPIQQARPVRQALASIDGAYTLVRGYDAVQQRWMVFNPAKADNDPSNTLKQLVFGQGYEITVTRDVILRLRGNGLTPGSGTTSAASAVPALYYGTLASSGAVMPAAGMPVVASIAGRRCGQGVVWNDSGRVRYVVVVAANAPGAVGCGTEGRLVTIQIGARTWTTLWDNTQARELRP